MVPSTRTLSTSQPWASTDSWDDPASHKVSTWIRDFCLLGAGIGLLAPQTMLIPLVLSGFPPIIPIIPIGLTGACSFLGASLGVGVGLLMWGTRWISRDHPLALFWMGFPVGALAGWVVGTLVELGLVGSGVEIGSLGMVTGGLVTGGLVLGFVWAPYLALRLRGRSGLAAIVTGVLASPVAGAVALLSSFML